MNFEKVTTSHGRCVIKISDNFSANRLIKSYERVNNILLGSRSIFIYYSSFIDDSECLYDDIYLPSLSTSIIELDSYIYNDVFAYNLLNKDSDNQDLLYNHELVDLIMQDEHELTKCLKQGLKLFQLHLDHAYHPVNFADNLGLPGLEDLCCESG